MTALPLTLNSRWLATLKNSQLLEVEARLYADFHARELVEKTRAGSRYILLQGPAALVNAWQQWLLVNNEARARGVTIRRSAAK
jgi:hypothetical protein